MPLIDHFNLLAPWYDQVIQSRIPEKLLQLIDLPQRGLVLDAGGGTGRIAQYLYGDGRMIVIADLSTRMLAQAGSKSGLERVCSESEKLPFRQGTFDRIVMVDALHHVADQRQTIAELYRVLKPGGRILVEEPDVRQTSVKFMAIAEKLALMRSRLISPPGIIKLFNYSGASARFETEGHNCWVVVDKLK
jgi:ubiquinone/menaquinone biosynthesis C-methylase UbiE